jgi:hypothetical protein
MTKRQPYGIGPAGRAFAASVARLADAIEFADRFPLPRCRHGNALRDHGGDRLEPSCGCRSNGEIALQKQED